ncbi:MAG: aquaporin [Thermodesulfobacteriota bacterium]
MSVAATASAPVGREPEADDGRHWPEYAIEAGLLGLFMVSACACTALVEHPASALRAVLPTPLARRALVGAAMGLTAVALIYSPWGQRSGAHFNPAVTVGFLRLGRIAPGDAAGYVLAQCAGGALGVLLSATLLSRWISHPAVAYAVTVPGPHGAAAAFAAELTISFLTMTVVLAAAGGRLASLTGLLCGALVALYITFEAPLSGMSMNPARTFASAVVAGEWRGFWVYLTAPVLGMTLAAESFARVRGAHAVPCAKLQHESSRVRCIFCRERQAAAEAALVGVRGAGPA